jgi:hypothetical protein
MKRQICSYDMVAVPPSSYTVTDGEGDMYLCNWRCLYLVGDACSSTRVIRGHYTKRQKSYANTSCVEQTVPTCTSSRLFVQVESHPPEISRPYGVFSVQICPSRGGSPVTPGMASQSRATQATDPTRALASATQAR